MPPTLSELGHDYTGLEAALTSSPNLLNADPGITFYATDTKRVWVCDGSGVWGVVSPGNAIPGQAGSQVSILKLLTAMADNTPVNLCLITIPNAIMGAAIGIEFVGITGDGDSVEGSFWMAAIGRVAGANAKIGLGAKTAAATEAGVTATAVVTLSNTAVSGAVGAVNTFQLQAKVARTAGTSTNHVLLASIQLLNGFASGITVT